MNRRQAIVFADAPGAVAGIVIAIAHLVGLCGTSAGADEPRSPIVLVEKFDAGLSKDWFWGLGTWTAADGVLRGFESGPRRHGPIKMRRFAIRDGSVECEFRLIGRAKFAGIIFNGPQGRGHIVHVVLGRDQLRILAHPTKEEVVELIREPEVIEGSAWHRVKIEFKAEKITAALDGRTFTASHSCLAETKLTFGLGGDSGGPDGELAGALEFRNLRASATSQ